MSPFNRYLTDGEGRALKRPGRRLPLGVDDGPPNSVHFLAADYDYAAYQVFNDSQSPEGCALIRFQVWFYKYNGVDITPADGSEEGGIARFNASCRVANRGAGDVFTIKMCGTLASPAGQVDIPVDSDMPWTKVFDEGPITVGGAEFGHHIAIFAQVVLKPADHAWCFMPGFVFPLRTDDFEPYADDLGPLVSALSTAMADFWIAAGSYESIATSGGNEYLHQGLPHSKKYPNELYPYNLKGLMRETSFLLEYVEALRYAEVTSMPTEGVAGETLDPIEVTIYDINGDPITHVDGYPGVGWLVITDLFTNYNDGFPPYLMEGIPAAYNMLQPGASATVDDGEYIGGGVWRFSNVKINKAGVHRLVVIPKPYEGNTAASSGAIRYSSDTIMIVPGEATYLTISPGGFTEVTGARVVNKNGVRHSPSYRNKRTLADGTIGYEKQFPSVFFEQHPIKVKVTDATPCRNVVADYVGDVTLEMQLEPGGVESLVGALSGSLVKPFVQGVATFDDVHFVGVSDGDQRIVPTSPGLSMTPGNFGQLPYIFLSGFPLPQFYILEDIPEDLPEGAPSGYTFFKGQQIAVRFELQDWHRQRLEGLDPQDPLYIYPGEGYGLGEVFIGVNPIGDFREFDLDPDGQLVTFLRFEAAGDYTLPFNNGFYMYGGATDDLDTPVFHIVEASGDTTILLNPHEDTPLAVVVDIQLTGGGFPEYFYKINWGDDIEWYEGNFVGQFGSTNPHTYAEAGEYLIQVEVYAVGGGFVGFQFVTFEVEG